MPSVQARRTLVKSPPELWAELSDAGALSRRLEPFGEIRITRLEPESTVAWEGERARGTVEIEPSGWGTRVTLTAEAPEPEAEAEAVAQPEAASEPEQELCHSDAAKTAPIVATRPELPEPEPEPEVELPQTMAALGQALPLDIPSAKPGPVPRPGLWSRLFRRQQRRDEHLAEPPRELRLPEVEADATPLPSGPEADPQPTEPQPTVPPEPVTPEPVTPEPLPSPSPPAQPLPDPEPPAPLQPAAEHEPQDCPQLAAEELDGVLAGVLDDLGAAHHRPFSRG